MARGFILLFILLVGLCLGSKIESKSKEFDNRPEQAVEHFRNGYEYTFIYNGQISTGLSQNTKCIGQSSQQKSSTRIQAQCKIQFQSERRATLRLDNVRIGTLNTKISEPQKVHPIWLFEQKHIPSDIQEALQLPCQFSFVEGVVERVQFGLHDPAWSKNIKRSVLNMIQLNLKRNNAQQLRSDGSSDSNRQLLSQRQLDQPEAVAFTLPEVTIEGECQTTYTINRVDRQPGGSGELHGKRQQTNDNSDDVGKSKRIFNVTKSINFKQCRRVADVAYGYQTQPEHIRCAFCQQQWTMKQNLQDDQRWNPNPCGDCDPKEIKERTLDRLTVQRYVLHGTPDQYGIARVEQLSQYVYKNLRAEVGKCDGGAMQAVVASELTYRKAEKKQDQQSSMHQTNSTPGGREEDTLLYDNEWDVDEKRFYMYGDGELGQAPFDKVRGKADMVFHLLRKLATGPGSASDKTNGIELETSRQLQRLVETLRMCTMKELKEIQERLQPQSGAEEQRIRHLLADALAIAGTRNTIHMLVEQILKKQLSPTKATQTIKSLSNLPAPSDAQIVEVLRLCKNEVTHRAGGALQQSCWLTFGSMVGELCRHTTQKSAQQSFFYGGQSGFNKDELCPPHKKEIYKTALVQQYHQSETTYERVVALKALGNAGMDIATPMLEKIIHDKTHDQIIRVQAIDSLRRLASQKPGEIQRILLPLFENTDEDAHVRMTAFSMIMRTRPDGEIADQITYALMKEPSKDVKSFVFTTMQIFSESRVPEERQLAKHLKNALKLWNVDENSLSSSVKMQVPIYSDSEMEGVFLNFASVFSNHDVLPMYLVARLDTLLNDEFQKNSVQFSMTQQDIEHWYLTLIRAVKQQVGQTSTRGQRSSQQMSAREQLQSIISGLGIKGRHQSRTSSEQEQQSVDQQSPFAMFCVRVGDVDQMILPIDPAHATTKLIRRMLQGKKPSLANGELAEMLGGSADSGFGKHIRFMAALNVGEKSAKVPTSMGIPINVVSALPMLVSFEGQMQPHQNGLRVSLHPSISVYYMQKMETWLPIAAIGIESVHSVEVNVPMQLQMQREPQGGIEVQMKFPQGPGKTRMLGFHTLPVTYTREFDQKSKMLREPRLRTIQSEQFHRLQRSINVIMGEQTLGLPFHLKGHFHLPSDITDYRQIIRLLMATDNQIHVTFEPTEDTPKEIKVRMDGHAFRRLKEGGERPDLNNFYSNSIRFEHAYPEDFKDMSLEDHSQRRKELNDFLGKFKPSTMYGHRMMITAHTDGGRRHFKAQMKLDAICDSSLNYCKLSALVERSALPESGVKSNVDGEWTLKSRIQLFTPGKVPSVKQLDQLSQKKFICHAEAEWGESDNKQSITLRIQGESAKKPEWRRHPRMDEERNIEEKHQQAADFEKQRKKEQLMFEKRTAFLNKFDMVAEYKLQPKTQNFATRCFELLKSYSFWNTDVKYNTDKAQTANPMDGLVHATVVIDPITQRQCNISVKTPNQLVRINSVRLPTHVRPFPLVGRKEQKSANSFTQMFGRHFFHSIGRGASCAVDGRLVKTFDGATFKAPISPKCYSVLAKDCSGHEDPDFAVMMKTENDDNGRHGKKIMVVTPREIIECQPKKMDSNKDKPMKLQCKVNEKEVKNNSSLSSSSEEEEEEERRVEFDNVDMTSVTINVQGMRVRFNGKKANIKISNLYKNGQCGLCGHYDGDITDEWRMGNNEQAENLEHFHRSYSLKDKECSADDQADFYKKNSGKFMSASDKNMKTYMSSEDYNFHEGDDETWWGPPVSDNGRKSRRRTTTERFGKQILHSSSSSSSSSSSGSSSNDSQGNEFVDYEEPITMTKVIEYSHKICFSQQPVYLCPEGTTPAGDSSLYYQSGESHASQENKQQQKKIAFVCLDRSNNEAHKMQHQARKGIIVDLNQYSPSFQETVTIPARCFHY